MKTHKKTEKKHLIFLFVLLIPIGILVLLFINNLNPVGATPKVYKEALIIHELIEGAFKENRALTSYEKLKVEEFSSKLDDWKGEWKDETDKNKINFALTIDVLHMAETYAILTDYDDKLDKSDSQKFQALFKKSKAALGLNE